MCSNPHKSYSIKPTSFRSLSSLFSLTHISIQDFLSSQKNRTRKSQEVSRVLKEISRRELRMKRCCSVALVLLLVAFFSSKYSVEGRSLLTMTHSSQAVRDLPVSKEMKKEPLKGENDSFRRIPRSGSNPIQNK
jgi:Na+/H+ antiporter NhaD/arsenite permease-like protein